MVLKEIYDSFLQLVFPHVCSGCGSDHLDESSPLCIRCMASLPDTHFHFHANNPVEKIFWGRAPIVAATAQYYFTKESLIQYLMHDFKYRGRKQLGLQLGRLMGTALSNTNRFNSIEALIPLPLFPKKERRRGFNQASILCEGMADILDIPVLSSAVMRIEHTETQTHKGRIERWRNMEGKFAVKNFNSVAGKHVLLVDDVITTGATLEACANALIEVENVRVSVATLCVASK